MVPMRDGVRLATDLYRPTDLTGPLPTILMRTPYNKGANPAGDASDPSGGLSLFDAVERQLGRKLESRKRPMRVLVIDSIQEKPLD